MKALVSLVLFISVANAGEISFIGPCSEEPLFSTHLNKMGGHSVGYVSIEALERFSIPYLGSQAGINSIFNSPSGLEAMEVISDTEMLAYGWCYSVNGIEPNAYPDEVLIKEEDEVLWWYGYAHYKDGKWIAQCVPSFQRRSPQFCADAQKLPTQPLLPLKEN